MKMNQNPHVSIGMPIYNGERFLEETLDSLLAQTYTDFEIIISDNASTDRTESICKAYEAKDSRIHYYRNSENLGAARNYNRTVELAQGKYFKWAACDDFVAPEHLERCVAVLDQHPSVVLAYTLECDVDEEGQIFRKSGAGLIDLNEPKPHQRFAHHHRLWRKRSFMCANPIFGLMRTEVLRKTPLIGDFAWADLALLGELMLWGEFYEIPEYLFFFRWHENTSRAEAKLSWENLAAWYNPKNKSKAQMPTCVLFSQQLQSVNRVSMGLSEKMACYSQLAGWLSWKWKIMTKEMLFVVLQVTGKALRGKRSQETSTT
ncbi:MAG: glycosyltransferase family 2 protein [Microcoleaceae cyanobacterium]